jgi:WD40 repeat protein
VTKRQLTSWHPVGRKGVSDLTFEPDGRTFWITVFSDDKPNYSLERINLESGDVISRIIPANGKRFWHWLSPDGQTIATVRDHEIKFWKAATGQLLSTAVSQKGDVSFFSFSPDGQKWIAGSEGGGINLWRVEPAGLISNFEGESDVFGKFSPDGRLLVTLSFKGLSLRDPHTGELKQFLNRAGYPFAFSPDGSKLAATSKDRSIMLWDIPKN